MTRPVLTAAARLQPELPQLVEFPLIGSTTVNDLLEFYGRDVAKIDLDAITGNLRRSA